MTAPLRLGPGNVRPAASKPLARVRLRADLLVRAHGWLAVPFVAAVASRVYSTVLLALAAAYHHLPLLGARGITTLWDARWYFEIAANGYHAAPVFGVTRHDYAFFPLWPLVIRLTTAIHGEAVKIAAPLSSGLFCVAAVLVAAALAPAFGRRIATEATVLLGFSPAAWTFSMPYSESLFLLLAAAAFLATQPGRRGVVLFFASLARIAGVALVVVDGLRFVVSRGRDRGALLAAALGAAGFAVWWVTIALISHDPLGFLRGSPEWAGTTGIWEVAKVIGQPEPGLFPQLLVTAIVGLGAIVALRRDWRLGAYALIAIALGLLPGGFVSSMPRYALVAFPGFAGLATLAGRRGIVVLIIVAAIAQAAFVAISFIWLPLRAP